MKKLLILLLIPFLLQCTKDPNPSDNQNKAESKCYLKRIDYDADNAYSLYERDAENKLIKVSTYNAGKLWEIINFSYKGVNIHTKESYAVTIL